MSDETYNGFTNWDTWNLSLHLTNEEWIYNLAFNKTAKQIKRITEDYFELCGNDRIDIDKVNFDEIEESLGEEG